MDCESEPRRGMGHGRGRGRETGDRAYRPNGEVADIHCHQGCRCQQIAFKCREVAVERKYLKGSPNVQQLQSP